MTNLCQLLKFLYHAHGFYTQNLKNTQPLRNEIQTFIGRIIETPVNDENTELFKELKKILDNKLGLQNNKILFSYFKTSGL